MNVTGFGDVDVEYQNSLGYHLRIGWEKKTGSKNSFAIELKASKATFTANSMKLNGSNVADITAPDGTSLRELKGDGVGFRILFVLPLM